MKTYVTMIFMIFSQGVFATECELVLQRFVSILAEKGNLSAGENLYKLKFSANEFDESCLVTHRGREYTLYLHPDDVRIVISSKDEVTGNISYQGTFYSAYKK